MRYVGINKIKEGMTLAKDIVGKNGELLLKSGADLLSTYIERIKVLGYSGIYIRDELSEDIEINNIIEDNLRTQTVNTVKKAFSNIEDEGEINRKTFSTIDSLINNIVDVLNHII
jgi:hypothetical protein